MNKTLWRTLMLSFLTMLQLPLLSACSDNDDNGANVTYASHVSIIPQPVSIAYGNHDVALPSMMTVTEELGGMPEQLLKATLADIYGNTESISDAADTQAFIRITQDSNMKEEEYAITVHDDGINLSYASSQGLLWGVQTLRQILLQNIEGKNGKAIPEITISDVPKTSWRGFHIDVARHMFTLDYLKKLVDQLSFYKINRLQMHLTDDQGWRIEIKKYPRLTSEGAWRTFDKYDRDCIEKAKTDPSYTIDERFIRNGSEYGGYYTQDELRDFIQYATARGLEVIPEIDMPGHFSSGIKAYPELSCTGGTGWGEEFSYPVCAGRTENYTMLQGIISEVAALFPSTHFHLGADEVDKTAWQACPRCKAMIQEKNLGNMDGLQDYFVRQMADYIRDFGKIPMAWDDAFYETNPQDLLYTFWRDWKADQLGEMTQRGLQVIFMEWGHFYLSANPTDELLKELYNFDFSPTFKGVVRANIAGYQACVWTEHIPNETIMGRHTFPSLQAFSELTWSQTSNWSSFVNRLPWHLQNLQSNGLAYRQPNFLN